MYLLSIHSVPGIMLDSGYNNRHGFCLPEVLRSEPRSIYIKIMVNTLEKRTGYLQERMIGDLLKDHKKTTVGKVGEKKNFRQHVQRP